MGYKLLGFAVWQGGKWYVRRRFSGARRKLAIAGVTALAIGAAVAVAQRQSTSD